jgi:hypothetical protein
MNITKEQMLEYFDGILNRLDYEYTRTPLFKQMTAAIESLIESSGDKANENKGAEKVLESGPHAEEPLVKPAAPPSPAPSPGPSVEEGMTDEEGFRAIYALIEHAVNFAGGYFSTMTDQAMKGYFHFLRHPELKPAPLPAEVEEAMEYIRRHMEICIGTLDALAVIRAALKYREGAK